VTQANAATRRGTASASRWFARALLVVGGAIAGTAAAWAISTASASADPVSGATGNLPGGASNLVGDTMDTADATHSFTRDAALHPVGRVLGVVEQVARHSADNAPRVISSVLTPSPSLWNFLRPGGQLIKLPTLPGGKESGGQYETVGQPGIGGVAAAVKSPVGPVLTPPPAGQHAMHPGSGHDGDGRHGAHDEPFPFSPARGPLGPAGLPLIPGGPAAGDHLDGQFFSVASYALTFVDSHGPCAVRFGVRHVPVQPGSQPGVTPD